MAAAPMTDPAAQESSGPRCYALWVNEDGTAMVAELSPDQGGALMQEVEPEPAESAAQAVQMLTDMLPAPAEESPEDAAMAGYGKGAKPAAMGRMAPGKVFGDE